MADDEDKDLAEGKKGSGSMKLVIVAVVAATLVATGGTFGVLWFTGALSGGKAAAEGQQAHGDGAAGAEEAEEKEQHPPTYIALDPPFVVNFDNPTVARFLQVKVQVMTRDPEVAKAIEEHMPVIRNNLVMLFSGQKYEEVATREGKERLRKQTLAEIRKVLEERIGRPGVEDVYFTAFVMQ